MKMIVPDTWNIPQKLRERLGDTAGRQRAMCADGHLLLVLHEPPSSNNRERTARLLWRDPSGAWNWSTDGNQTDLLKKHIASFAERATPLENQLQAASCADDYFYLLQAIAPLARTSRNLHAALQQAREMIPDDRDIIVARDAAGDIERTFELLHLDAKNGLDYTVAQKAELQSQRSYEMAVSAHRLNVLAALFFPITAMSSLFAMNFSAGPEAFLSTSLFWGVLGAGSVSGLLLSRMIAPQQISVDPSQQAKKKLGNGSKQTSRRLPKMRVDNAAVNLRRGVQQN